MTVQRVSVFLSYAEEDGAEAKELVEALEGRKIDVWYWQDTRLGSTKWIEEIEQRIASAKAFIALVSPHYLTSYWCRQELGLALIKEQRLAEVHTGVEFVLVVRLSDCDVTQSFIGTRRMLDLLDGGYDRVASVLFKQLPVRILGSEVKMESTISNIENASLRWPTFQNRRAELHLLASDMINPGGNHFWYVLAGPQMGKTWFLQELPRRIGDQWTGVPRYIDLSKEKSSVLQNNGELLLLRLLGRPENEIDDAVYDQIVEDISGSNRSWLFMVDGAEWLDDKAASDFRRWTSRLYEDLTHAGMNGVPLVVVVAGRNRTEPWRGVTPGPEFRLLEMTHFEPKIVFEALKEVTSIDGRTFGNDQFDEIAHELHRLSEGLPALLISYMGRLREMKYVRAQRLAQKSTFERLAVPYVEEQLLSREALGLSIVQDSDDSASAQQEALTKSLGGLCTYRIFTASHIKAVVSEDSALNDLLKKAGWSELELRTKLGRTHLLKHSYDLWKELDPAIRRLLFRHFHQTPQAQLDRHRAAGRFYESWNIPHGKEQAVMRVEALWHRTEVARLEKADGGASMIVEYFQGLLDRVPEANGYLSVEVLENLQERLMEDAELQRSLSEIGNDLHRDLHRLIKAHMPGGSL